ncbi:hypothetical protein ATE92_0584 [Ulvibacter sp. MAR_2010_11]|uniref:hypothetical protein n=1 Tax=Ulvibacter sp. MAR_2010_11 TaxID=1250229 RepID=UPI000C2BDEE7|nr:hypothetical protein [Ulvibacter sp. MAR_2010_11]PKA82455.1 hypothetical protein ATE92_0584 [Ulvibacter sp. MAR_2010_11]
MTPQEIQQAVTYFNSIRNSNRILIEAEMRHIDKSRFDTKYTLLTGVAVPVISNAPPYYVWAPHADPNSKWGIELRIYFVSDNTAPVVLMGRAKNNSRHGYKHFDKRINYNKLIWDLFANGFTLGPN